MLRVTLAGLLARKLRLALSAIAVVLGVAFVTGTLVLTDTIRSTFDDVFSTANQGTAVQVRSANSLGSNGFGNDDRPPVPAGVVAQVRAVPGVKDAVGEVTGAVQAVGPDGQRIGNDRAPTLGFNYEPSSLSSLHLVAGHAPAGPDQVVVDQKAVANAGLSLGDKLKILTHDKVVTVSLVGVVRFGDTGDLAGATLVAFESATAQELLGSPGGFQDVVASSAGPSEDTLQQRVSQVLGEGFDVRTGSEVSSDTSKSIASGLGFFTTMLLVFAFIALFVGGFVIANTFQVLVAQRTRELALLRALGASRRQVLMTVLAEGGAIGLIGAVAGFGLGLLAALGLKALLKGFGLDLPATGIDIRWRTPVVALLVGVVVSVLSAVLPAWRAGRVPPVAAMREAEFVTTPGKARRGRIIIGSGLAILGVLALLGGLSGKGNAALVGIGALCVILAVTTLSQLFASPVVSVLGAWLPRYRGTVGRLARDNAVRNPRRTASTAAALMIGLAVVGAFTVVLSSVTASVKQTVHDSISAQLVVHPDNFNGAAIPTSLEPVVAKADGVTSVVGMSDVRVRLDGDTHSATLVPQNWQDAVRVHVAAGSLDLPTGTVVVSQTEARKHDWAVGRDFAAETAQGGTTSLRLAGIYQDNILLGDYVIRDATLPKDAAQGGIDVLLVSGAGSPDTLAASVKQALGSTPGIKVETQQEYLHSVENQVNQLLGLVIVLLALAILIAGLGVVNTLALSVVERTREIGLLRAVGLSRRQLRSVVRWESVLICTYGAILGVVVGAALGSALVKSLSSQGFNVISLGLPTLIVCLIVAAIGGVAAGAWPARRAAKLDPLQAIASA